MLNHYKHIISKAIGYTFSRMTIYLTVFNFAMLCLWVYDNTELGAMFKENGYRPGDVILVIIFVLFAISVLDYILIGRDRDE